MLRGKIEGKAIGMMTPFPSDASQETRVPVETARRVIEQILVKKSLFQFDASTATQRMIDADRFGIPAHGIGRIVDYVAAMDLGDIDPRGRVLVMDDQPAYAVMDGSRAIGHVASTKGMETAIQKATDSGIGFVCVGNSQTLGAASVYTRLAAEAGMIGICLSSTGGATVTAPGTNAGAVGNTAIAFAIPVQDSHPLVFDSACGQESWAKLNLLKRYGVPIPDGILLTEDGTPTNDVDAAKFQFPASGLGFGMSLLSSILAGPLCGGWMPIRKTRTSSAEDSQHVFLAFNIEKFVAPERFQKQLVFALDAIRALPVAAGSDSIRLPGDRGAAISKEVDASGIPLHNSVLEEVRSLASSLKVETEL